MHSYTSLQGVPINVEDTWAWSEEVFLFLCDNGQ